MTNYGKTMMEALAEVRGIKEDGHTDVASAMRQCKTMTEDAMQILQKLQTMSPEDSLPSWWTNKLAVASNSMNKLRDYIIVPTNEHHQKDENGNTIPHDDEEVELDEAAGDLSDMKKLVGELQNASKMHLAQSKRVKAHVDMMKGSKDLEPIVGELEKASQAHQRQSKTIDAHIKGMKEYIEDELDEKFDYVLLDKDNKIVGRYSGKNAKKSAQSGKFSAHLPPMRIPKNEVGKMKIVPINPKDKKGIGDMVLAIGEEVELGEGYEKEVLLVLKDAGISGSFRSGRLYVDKQDVKDARSALKDSDKFRSLPRIVGEEVELDESKMKQVKSLIDDIANAMRKDRTMKAFADKFVKDAQKTLDPRKSLEKVLPDYVPGKDIARLLNMGEEVKLDENASRAFDSIIKDGGIDKKDFQKAKQLYMKKDLTGLRKFIYNLDTAALEAVMDVISRNDSKAFMKMYPRSKGGEYMSSIAYAHRND